jgi:hypothetical protein
LDLTPSIDVMSENIPELVSDFLMGEKRNIEEHIQLFSSLPTEDEVLEGTVSKRFKTYGKQSETGV